MPTGRALVVGLREVNPAAYGGDSLARGVQGAEEDVDRVAQILADAGFTDVVCLKTQEATAEAILQGLEHGVLLTEAGDTFVFYCAGHATQAPDSQNDPDELDQLDEEFCAYDRKILDDEFGAIWRKYSSKAQIVMIADCCHAGTLYTMLGVKSLCEDADIAAFVEPNPPMQASLLHMAAVGDPDRSIGFDGGGLFTIEIANAWNDGRFTGTYQRLFEVVAAAVDFGSQGEQRCELHTFGPDAEQLTTLLAFRI